MRLNNTYSTHIARKYVLQRELGLKFPLGFRDKLHHKIYSSLQPTGPSEPDPLSCTKNHSNIHGGVFNLEYSPDGSVLIAACEQKNFIVLDPVTRKNVHYVYNAHSDCVNCVRFLDSRTFATCSDDTTVALWDIRNVKHKLRTLRGHSNWVKNIEYVRDEGLLVTSGFDGCIFTWDINSYTEQGLMSQRVFHTNGLMRMRLTPDCSKMILCTAGGYIMVVHNLDFSTLNQDLAGFKPNVYRLMQISQTPIATNFSHLFTSKRNRIELISDWPDGNEAEVISALQVHPYGWCVISRNSSNGDRSEWTCVHDIQDVPSSPLNVQRKRTRSEYEGAEPSASYSLYSSSSSSSSEHSDEETLQPTVVNTALGPQVEVRITAPLQWGARPGEGAGFHFRLDSAEGDGNANSELTENVEVRIPSEEVLEALESIRRARSSEERNRPEFRVRHRIRNGGAGVRPTQSESSSSASSSSSSSSSGSSLLVPSASGIGEHPTESAAVMATVEENVSWEESDPNLTAHFVRAVADLAARSVHLIDPFRLRSRHSVRRHPPSLTYDADNPAYDNIHSNLNRITHFVQEPNVGRGYIKELCFSPDGRVIASPFGHGVRLLTFNPQCADMVYNLSQSTIVGSRCHAIDKEPAYTLHELSTTTSHSDVVVTTKFSPTHPVFVSGCLGGKIIWHQPLL